MLFNAQLFTCYFGDASDQIYKETHCVPSDQLKIVDSVFKKSVSALQVPAIAFLNQVHGTAGITVRNTIPFFGVDGDFLITQRTDTAIGVVTADCTPVIIYDPKHHAIGIAHAGWKGAVAGVNKSLLAAMRQAYGTKVADVQLLLGPTARACCYQVSPEFVQALDAELQQSVIARNSQLFLDMAALNKVQLQRAGITPKQIQDVHAQCTLCNYRFCSYRRQGVQAGRQVTAVRLRY